MSAPPLALVTGGVRRIGAAIAAALARAGYRLALHGNRDAVPEPILAQILADSGCEWAGFCADLSARGSPGQLLSAVIAHFGRAPDLIVNNASLFEFDDRASASLENLERHMRVNMMAPTRLTLGLAGALAEGERAAVVNIIDQRIRNPIGDQLSYTLSKQALAESVRTLARACADRLRVNGVAPGLTIATPDYDDDQMQRLTAAMPLRHLPSPDDVAGAVLYLAGAQSVTGQTIFVDGGAHMKSFDRDFLFMEKD